jgi:hypothetical protein
MATVADIVDQAARRCSVTPPSSWVSSTTATGLEFKDIIQEVKDEILERLDLPSPITTDTTITGTGVASYSLPSDFLRLTRDQLSVYETSSTRRSCIPVSTNGAWTHLQEIGSSGGERYYRLAGDEAAGFTIEFYDALETGSTVKVSYVTRNWLRTSGTASDTWTATEDYLLLPPLLFRLGIVWRFKSRKGLPYADIMAEYETKLSRAINDRRQIKSINMGGSEPRMPWDIPVPDFIPSS